MEVTFGSFTFSSNFECGNLAKVLPIHLSSGIGGLTSIQRPQKTRGHDAHTDYEFNLWTKPDCGGTEFENNNRTWFCFCIKGGVAGERVQLSVMNLNKQSKLYSQGMQPVVRCVGDLGSPSNWERIKEKCSYRSEENSTVVSWMHVVPPEGRSTYYAFTYPFTYCQLQTFLDRLDSRFHGNTSSLYYHRELLTKSLDGSRVDLVTITSQLGRREEREDRVPGLFPDWSCPRPHRFEGKKVVFVSARVHPGETPSSFVLNGFLNFIISEDPRAQRLRNGIVFKVVPMLNPDGVIRGHYRTDQRGVNLNRVYSNPCPRYHPTIYATKKMILYYHNYMRCGGRLEASDLDASGGSATEVSSQLASPLRASTPPILDEDTCHSFSDAVVKATSPVPIGTGTSTGPGRPPSLMEADEPSASGWDISSNQSADNSWRAGSLHTPWDDAQEEPRFYPGVESGLSSMFDSLSPLRDLNPLKDPSGRVPPKGATALPFLHGCLTDPPGLVVPSSSTEPQPEGPVTLWGSTPESRVASAPPAPGSVLEDSSSNLFMYMDFHGHASKRGIFMYGNWFEDRMMMVENLLYPKLLSLNCSNFDFGACNFTERNMYHKDRRDGMSKEGSGRVSVMLATGLVRSYTLECNYNTGRILNTQNPQGAQTRSLSLHSVPPKYTPATFEDCGHKLGVCLHDLVTWGEGTTTTLSPPNLSLLRAELFHTLAVPGVSPRTSTLSSCTLPPPSTPKVTPVKPLAEESQAKSSTSKGKSASAGGTGIVTPKLPSLHVYGRRQNIVVDAENQEPKPRTIKTKVSRSKKEPCGDDTVPAKIKKPRHKVVSNKGSPTHPLLFKDVEEESHFTTKAKLGPSKSYGDGTFKGTSSDKPEVPKLAKKLEKGRKQRAKTPKFGTKKLKNVPATDASKGSLKDVENPMGTPLEPLCVGSPLSPRSPLASVFEAQTSHTSPGGKKSPSFHSAPKRPGPKAAPGGDRFSLVPGPAGQRLKLFPRKTKKKTPSSQGSSLHWVIRKPLGVAADLETSNPLNPMVKKRKKSTRKSL